MSVSFSGSLVGSWLCTRSTGSFKPRIVHHFTTDGKCHWEMDCEEKRILTFVRYRCDGSKLTVIYSNKTERDFELTTEDDGSVKIPGLHGVFWWMIHLTAPEPYSIAFVDQNGQLEKLQQP